MSQWTDEAMNESPLERAAQALAAMDWVGEGPSFFQQARIVVESLLDDDRLRETITAAFSDGDYYWCGTRFSRDELAHVVVPALRRYWLGEEQ